MHAEGNQFGVGLVLHSNTTDVIKPTTGRNLIVWWVTLWLARP